MNTPKKAEIPGETEDSRSVSFQDTGRVQIDEVADFVIFTVSKQDSVSIWGAFQGALM